MREGFLWGREEGYSFTPQFNLRCLCNSEVLLASYTRQFSCILTSSKNCNHCRFSRNKALPEILGDRQPHVQTFSSVPVMEREIHVTYSAFLPLGSDELLCKST